MTKTMASTLVTLGQGARAGTLACAVVAAGFLPGLACGGGPKPAQTAAAPSDTPATLDSPSSSAAPSGSGSAAPDSEAAAPLAQVLTTDKGQIGKLFDAANAAPPATLKPNGVTGSDPLSKGVREAANKLPAGMKPEGPLAMGSLKEKQHLQTDVTLQPGKCYSIVGYSLKVKDLDLYLFLPPGILSGQDLTDDNKPIVGGPPQPMCPVSSAAVTYKIDIYADQGAGDVAVQLYAKGN